MSDSDKKPSDTNQSEQQGFDQETGQNSRRTLVKSLTAGSVVVTGSQVLPNNWARPVTKSIILPAHAGTTAPAADGQRGADSAGGEGGEDSATPAPTPVSTPAPRAVGDRDISYFAQDSDYASGGTDYRGYRVDEDENNLSDGSDFYTNSGDFVGTVADDSTDFGL